MLRSFGLANIDEAANGEDAIKKLSSNIYDVILCDYNLGEGRDGQQILEEARFKGYIGQSTIYVMVTAENSSDMIMGALEYQPDDYLVKPFAKEALERKLKDCLEMKESLRNVEKALIKKDYDTVILMCDEIIKEKPKNIARLLKLKGEVLIEKGDYVRAKVFYEEVMLIGNLPWAIMGLGKIAYFTGAFDDAQRIFENIIAQNDKIVSAYDWLAKVLEEKGDLGKAQEVLHSAIVISPKAILRQKALGNLAYRNNNIALAEQTFKEVVRQGKHSIFKETSDYTTLVTVLVEQDLLDESLAVLNDAAKEFSTNADALTQIGVTQISLLRKMDRGEDADKVMEKILKSTAGNSGEVLLDTELALAKVLIQSGDEQAGNDILRRLIQSNHEDRELMERVQALFGELKMEDKGEDMIAALCEEVSIINNDGVKLVRDGELESAVTLFEKAVSSLPGNKIINANAAQAYMLYMKKHGITRVFLEKTRESLERVRTIDSSYRDLNTLWDQFKELAKGT